VFIRFSHTSHKHDWSLLANNILLLCMRAGRKSNSPGKELQFLIPLFNPRCSPFLKAQCKKKKESSQNCRLCNLSDGVRFL
jgi:hypothetical protein